MTLQRLFQAGALLLSASSLLTQTGCSRIDAAHASDTVEDTAQLVRLSEVQHGPVTRRVRAAGTLALKRELDLAFKVGGVVTRVAVERGAHIRRGQLLATVDPTELRAGLSQAQQGVEKATRDLERVRKLHTSGALPVADLQNAETAYSVAQATYEAAAFNVRHSAIVAPDHGVIDRRMLEVGQVVAPGQPAFHMSGTSRGAVVRVWLADRDVIGLSLGDRAKVVLDAMPQRPLAAHVSEIATVASPGTGTFEVEVSLDEGAQPGLLSGLTAKVEIEHLETPSATVPIAALVDGHGTQAHVFVVEGARAKRVPVSLKFLVDDRAALATGLERESRVVEAGAPSLSDGARVRVLP